MDCLNKAKSKIEELGLCGGGVLLIQAVASACNAHYGVNLGKISYVLDNDNKELVYRLMNITKEPDFCNAAQSEMLVWLESSDLLDIAATYKKE